MFGKSVEVTLNKIAKQINDKIHIGNDTRAYSRPKTQSMKQKKASIFQASGSGYLLTWLLLLLTENVGGPDRRFCPLPPPLPLCPPLPPW